MGRPLLVAMQRAVERAQGDPASALRWAREALGTSNTHTDPEVEATALWAVGLASRELNDLAAADSSLRASITIADRSGLGALAARIRVSHALVASYLGEPDLAMDILRRAQPMLRGTDLAHARQQRALLYQREGRHLEAIDEFARALPVIVENGDLVGEVRIRSNRAVAEVYLGEFDAAQADLTRAREAAASIDQTLQVASCSHNLAFVHGRRGELADSLAWFEQALSEYADLGVDHASAAVLLVDRAEVLANVGMVTEALSDAAEARRRLATTENVVELAETDLLVARIALMAGDRARAHEAAIEAEAAFIAQERGPWAVVASAIAFRTRDDVDGAVSRCRFLSSDVSPGRAARLAGEGSALAQDLAAAGWAADARIVAIIAGRLWRAGGDDVRAIEQLEPVAATRSSGSAIQRVQGWQAEALIRIMRDNRAGARRAIRAGLDTIAAYRTTMVATDLRATVSVIGDQLSAWLVELAIDGGRARDVLGAAEAWRAGSLVAPVAAPDDPELERLLGELRAADADRRTATAGADARRARLETAVRDRARQLPGSATAATPHVDVGRVISALGGRLLIEYVERDGALYAVTMASRRARLHHLGPVNALASEIQSMRASLQRLARGAGSARSLVAARDALTHAAAAVGDALLGPLPTAGGAEMVIIPTGLLHGVPWAALDRLRATPFAVAPSAGVWHAAATRPRRSGGAVLAAGPDLDGAVTEVDAIAAALADATVLTGSDATVDGVLAALDGAGLAHFAAHGDFRADNPQLCSLRLADGDLRVYDLERLGSIPPIVVLSACDAGAVTVKAGDELLGFSAAVLGLGAASLVAPVVPIHDEATVDLMVTLHRHLADGVMPGEALQRARCDMVDDGGPNGARALAAAASFLVIGS